MAVKKKTILLSTIHQNPDNPRLIKDVPFKKLVNNLLKYPKFLRERPIVQKDNMAIGGNQRYKALEHIIGLKDAQFKKLATELRLNPKAIAAWEDIRKTKAVPAEWVRDASDYSEEEIKAFIILDNRPFGEDNWEMLANEWDKEQLEEWGVNTSAWDTPETGTKTVSFEVKDKPDLFILTIECDNERHCQQLYEKYVGEGLKVKIVR